MRYRFGRWVLDSDLYELRHADQPMKIEPKVFDVLVYLVEHRDRVISKQELFEHLWPGQHIGASALERCITAARKILGDSGETQRMLRTLHGRGYRFVADVETDSPKMTPANGHASERAPHPAAAPALRQVAPIPSNGRAMDKGKRKLATTLSCSLGNALTLAEELGTEAMHDLLERFFLHSLRQVQEANGRLIHLLDDGFLALFGPASPGANSALEAVQAAVELQALWSGDLETYEITEPAAQLRFGLHTGMIAERKIGAEQHSVYMPVGDTIHLANALQHHAEPGTILSSETTHRRVQADVDSAMAGLMPIEAKATSAAAYYIFGLRDIAIPPPHLMPSIP